MRLIRMANRHIYRAYRMALGATVYSPPEPGTAMYGLLS